MTKFNTLNEKTKIKKLRKLFRALRYASNFQIEIVKKHKENRSIQKDILHHYLYFVFNNFWTKCDLFFDIGINKHRPQNGLILRAILEQLIQFLYFTSLKKDEQNLLTHKELIRIMRKFYEREKPQGTEKYWEDQYKSYTKSFSQDLSGYPQTLANIKLTHIDSFPKIKEMLKKSQPIIKWHNIQNWEHDYKYLCESAHNGLFMFEKGQPNIEYRQNLMFLCTYCMEMLKVTDLYYLNKATSTPVANVLNHGKSLIN